MFIRQHSRMVNGRRRKYWALVESHRTERGPRQRVVAWLGGIDEAGRLGVQWLAEECRRSSGADGDPADALTRPRPLTRQTTFEFDDDPQVAPRWVTVDARGVRVENLRQFGGPWLALHLIRTVGLDEFLDKAIPAGRELIGWDITSLILVIGRLLEPASELFTAEQWYDRTALPDLLGVAADRVDDNRLYRALDRLLPHKEALEVHLKQRMGDLFDLEYDLLMYDITSTYFEGQQQGNPMAQRGYSRDSRSDCKQVCIGLVVSKCGMPLGYEVFAGNTADVTTVEHIVETMENRYGRSDRIWVMDRGMVSEDNIDFLIQGGRRYIVGTHKSMLKKFEAEILKDDWNTIRDGLEVKLCRRPRETSENDDSSVSDDEVFILCRSHDRSKKEEAIVRRSEEKIEARLNQMKARCEKQNRDPMKVEREVGRLLGQNTRAARIFQVTLTRNDNGSAKFEWTKVNETRDWATVSAGCYLLRSNVTDWSDEDLWRAYIQLTEAEAAFRVHKSDLKIRPVWHQKEDRVLAHIFVCFLAYVLWKTLAAMCQRAGLGNEPRRVLRELSEIRSMDVVLPTQGGPEIRTRCVSKPSEHQQILLDHLGLKLPTKIIQRQM